MASSSCSTINKTSFSFPIIRLPAATTAMVLMSLDCNDRYKRKSRSNSLVRPAKLGQEVSDRMLRIWRDSWVRCGSSSVKPHSRVWNIGHGGQSRRQQEIVVTSSGGKGVGGDAVREVMMALRCGQGQYLRQSSQNSSMMGETFAAISRALRNYSKRFLWSIWRMILLTLYIRAETSQAFLSIHYYYRLGIHYNPYFIHTLRLFQADTSGYRKGKGRAGGFEGREGWERAREGQGRVRKGYQLSGVANKGQCYHLLRNFLVGGVSVPLQCLQYHFSGNFFSSMQST